MGLFGGLNELVRAKCLEQFLVPGITASYYWFIIIITIINPSTVSIIIIINIHYPLLWHLQAECISGENSGEIAILSAGNPETQRTQCPSAPDGYSC